MKSGPRHHLVTFLRDTGDTRDAHNAPIENFTAYASGYCSVHYGSGQERREAAQTVAMQTATFETLWTPTLAALTPKDRASFQGDWDIKSVVTIGLNEGVAITAVKRAA